MKKFLNAKVKDMNAITLIVLVITIVVLIILAAVAINLSLGNNGIFNRAKTGKELYQNAEEYDKEEVARTTNKIDSIVGGNRSGVTISQEEYDNLMKKGTWELITTSNKTGTDSAAIMNVSDLSKYSNFGLLIYFNDQYLAYTNMDYNLLKTGKYFFASYKDSGQYYAGLQYLSDTQIKLWIDSTRNTEQAELYGIY